MRTNYQSPEELQLFRGFLLTEEELLLCLSPPHQPRKLPPSRSRPTLEFIPRINYLAGIKKFEESRSAKCPSATVVCKIQQSDELPLRYSDPDRSGQHITKTVKLRLQKLVCLLLSNLYVPDDRVPRCQACRAITHSPYPRRIPVGSQPAPLVRLNEGDRNCRVPHRKFFLFSHDLSLFCQPKDKIRPAHTFQFPALSAYP